MEARPHGQEPLPSIPLSLLKLPSVQILPAVAIGARQQRRRHGRPEDVTASSPHQQQTLGGDNGEVAELVNDGGAEAVSSSPMCASSSR